MLIRLNVDQVSVVGLWGFGARPTWGWADMGPGQDGAGLTWGLTLTTQSRKFKTKSNKIRI